MAKYWVNGKNWVQHWTGTTWEEQDISAATNYPNLWLKNIHGCDYDNIFCVGHDSTNLYNSNLNPVLISTSDGGTTWINHATEIARDIPINTGYTFHDVYAISATEVYIVGHEHYSSQDYYIWKWDGTEFTQLGSIIDWHMSSIFAANSTNIYVSSEDNGVNLDYSFWNGSSHTVDNIADFGPGGLVRGVDEDNVHVLSQSSPFKLATGSHSAGWTVETLKTGFYSSLDSGGNPGRRFEASPGGDLFIIAYDTTETTMQAAVKSNGSWSYSNLGASENRTGGAIFAPSNGLACCMFNDTGSSTKCFMFDGNSWIEESTGLTHKLIISSMWGYGPPITLTDDDPVTSVEIEAAKDFNHKFYFAHIEGFPYLWFTDVPTNWSAPSGWTYKTGLLMTPFNEESELRRSQSMDILSGVEDTNSINISIIDPTVLDDLTRVGRSKSSTNYSTVDDEWNDIAAGSDEDIETETEMTGASTSGGTIYLGNQTCTYTSRSGTTFTGVDRGKYHSLDDDLDEYEWKPFTDWDTVANVKTEVTTYPNRIQGRNVTLYRSYFHAETGLAMPIEDSQVRFRGRITTFGKKYPSQAYTFHVTSIPTELNQVIMKRPAICKPKGYSIPKNASLDNIYNSGYSGIAIYIKEELQCTEEPGEIEGYPRFEKAFDIAQRYNTAPVERLVTVNDQQDFEHLGDLVKAVNAAFLSAWERGDTKAFWYCGFGENNNVIIGYHTIGYTNTSADDGYDYPVLLTYLNQTDPLTLIVKGSLKCNLAANALGFGEADDSWVEIGNLSSEEYMSSWALRTGRPNDVMVLPEAVYVPMERVSDEAGATSYFRYDNATRIPTDVQTDHGFTETPADGSPFLIKIDDNHIMRASHINTDDQNIYLEDSKEDYINPIGQAKSPKDPFLRVPEGTPPEETPEIRQVWKPTNKHTYQVPRNDADGFFIEIVNDYGIHITMLQLMLSTGTAGYNGVYDILPVGWGLSIPSNFVDITSFENLYDEFPFDALQRDYIFHEPMDFIDFLIQEAMTLGFLVIMKDGKITAIPSENKATSRDVVATINDSMRIVNSDYTWRTNPEGIYNTIKIKTDYDTINDKFYRTEEFHDRASQIDSNISRAIEVENYGLMSKDMRASSNLALNEVRQMMMDRLSNYSRDVFDYGCTVNRKADGLRVGDTVAVVDERVPNHVDGTTGISYHQGKIVRFDFDELADEGEIVVRFQYEFPERILVAADYVAWNQPVMAPAVTITEWNNSEELIYDVSLLDGDAFSSDDIVQFTNINTGEQIDSSIASIDTTTGLVTLNTAVPEIMSSEEIIMSYPNYNDYDLTTEVLSAYISSEEFVLGTGGGYIIG